MKKLKKPNYLLDANVFLEAQLRYYAFDLCPGFWDALLRHQLGSIDRVRDELVNDELKNWLNQNVPENCFASTDDENVIRHYRDVIAWVQTQDRYFDRAKAEFANEADGWLLAYAITTNSVVVTQEKAASNARNKVRLPEVCKPFKVKFIDTFDMLRGLGASFHLLQADDGE